MLIKMNNGQYLSPEPTIFFPPSPSVKRYKISNYSTLFRTFSATYHYPKISLTLFG